MRRRSVKDGAAIAVAALLVLVLAMAVSVMSSRRNGVVEGASLERGEAGADMEPGELDGGSSGASEVGGGSVPLPPDFSGDPTETRVEQGDLAEVAWSVLQEYRDEGTCVLASSGYLDLLGNVWGCVVLGDGWADVCVVSTRGDGQGSVVQTIRMTPDEVASLLEEEGVSDEGGGSEGNDKPPSTDG